MSDKTPGQRACETFWMAIREQLDADASWPGSAWDWAQSQQAQDAWEAAAQAAVSVRRDGDWETVTPDFASAFHDDAAEARAQVTELQQELVTARAVIAEAITAYDAATARGRTPGDKAQLDDWNAALATLRKRAGLER